MDIPPQMSLILHDIRSAHNVGSLFRTADAAGVEHIFLTGYTPAPLDRFGRKRHDVAKTALGAEESMPWTQSDIDEVLNTLASLGVSLVAVEQGLEACDYRTLSLSPPFSFIVGNEVSGISQEICMRCEYKAEIPQAGNKESLNVSVAAGIVLFRHSPFL